MQEYNAARAVEAAASDTNEQISARSLGEFVADDNIFSSTFGPYFRTATHLDRLWQMSSCDSVFVTIMHDKSVVNSAILHTLCMSVSCRLSASCPQSLLGPTA